MSVRFVAGLGIEHLAEVLVLPARRFQVKDQVLHAQPEVVERLLQLESLLGTRVVGHEDITRRISDALRKGAAGFRGRRPLATFLFLGPTGVGKTEMAKAISDVFFGTPMTRLDMSELGESHTVARMLGAPPGYVGHNDGGQLTEAVRRRPYQLLLLDEIEKAHPEVLLSLLPIFLSSFETSPGVTWRASNGVLGLYHLLLLGWILPRYLRGAAYQADMSPLAVIGPALVGVATIVLNAIEQDEFYIYTHPEAIKEMAKLRFDDFLGAKQPSPEAGDVEAMFAKWKIEGVR